MTAYRIKRIISLAISFSFFISVVGWADDFNQPIISLFPIEKYDQTIGDWIHPIDADYQQPLLTADEAAAWKDEFYERQYGSKSPWSPTFIEKIIASNIYPPVNRIYNFVKSTLDSTSASVKNQTLYGPNFRPVTEEWFNAIVNNINLAQFSNLTYTLSNRAIVVDNVSARGLPTDDPLFNFGTYATSDHAGEGYPFDSLQYSAVWAGTPVYIFGQTQDGAWYYVRTPDFEAGWIPSNKVAKADNHFVRQWQERAREKDGLVAIVKTKIGIADARVANRFYGYIGMTFPRAPSNDGAIHFLIPIMGKFQHAHDVEVVLEDQTAVAAMPFIATPEHFTTLMSQLIHRPYVWGDEYFYNDCSAELKSLYTPFGIWLPRNSSQQIKAGQLDDQSALSPEARIAYLKNQSLHKFLTIVNITGHVFMYMGNYSNAAEDETHHQEVVLTYQNVWGLRRNATLPDSRIVIGESALLPLLPGYPDPALGADQPAEDNLISLAAKSAFKIIYLNRPNVDAEY